MNMRFTEIGQQLRAYRLESGLRAEEIAARLGVSRAALYRYEKGEVIKLDTIQRLAELLKISPLSLLGIGMEYYTRPIGYFERIRQLEETADQMLQVQGAISYLTSSERFDLTLLETFEEHRAANGNERLTARAAVEQMMGIQAARKRMFQHRRPSIISMFTSDGIKTLLQRGLAGHLKLSEGRRRLCRDAAAAEVGLMADIMESEPMGLQFGLLTGEVPNGHFKITRSRDRASLALNTFAPDSHPGAECGVAVITGADEAVAAHQRAAEASWREALKGAAAAAAVRALLTAARE